MYIVILKIFDHKLAEIWHSGSNITTEAKWGFKTKKEAKFYFSKPYGEGFLALHTYSTCNSLATFEVKLSFAFEII